MKMSPEKNSPRMKKMRKTKKQKTAARLLKVRQIR
jgi:hypothetical protein